jgi:phosphopantothenoylcysteine synthetase/decarboxylase
MENLLKNKIESSLNNLKKKMETTHKIIQKANELKAENPDCCGFKALQDAKVIIEQGDI